MSHSSGLKVDLRLEYFISKIGMQDLVLDVGIAFGEYWRPYIEAGRSIIGLDFSFETLRIAKERYNKIGCSIELICGDANALPFLDSSFGGVWSRQVYQHVKNMDLVLHSFRKIRTLLKDRGIFVYNHLNYSELARVIYFLFRKNFPKETDDFSGMFLRRLSAGELEHYLSNIFQKVEMRFDMNFFHPELKFLPRNRILSWIDLEISGWRISSKISQQLTAICYT